MPEVSPPVLVIRLDAIGDALALTPALASWRRHAIPFDLVLTERNAGIFARTTARRTIVADFALRSSAQQNLAAIERQGARLRHDAYAYVIVATEDPGGYRLASAIGAPVRIGFADPWTKPFKAVWTRRLLTQPIYRSARLHGDEHECETLFRLIAPLTADTAPSRDAHELRPLILDAQPSPDHRVALQLTDKWRRLNIARDDVEALLRALQAAGPLRVIASRGESAYAAAIAETAGVAVDYFDGVDAWKAAVAAARVVVAPDSGAIHLAGMVGTPVVAVFPQQRAFDAQIARWSPWASAHRILRAHDGWPQRAAQAVAELGV
jgi:ADP-heptose:LPS heptosyltransferase